MIELIQTCSPQMQIPVAQAIIKTESSFKQFAIGVNKGGKPVRQPSTYKEAVATAKQLIASGANIDMGYAQINSKNLKWLGLSVEQIFEPCANLKAMQTVYQHCYNRAGNTGLGTRMQRAFSCYNTGNMTSGFRNGYVNKVTSNFNEFASNSNQIKYNQYPQYTQKKVEYIPLPHLNNPNNPNPSPVPMAQNPAVPVPSSHTVARAIVAQELGKGTQVKVEEKLSTEQIQEKPVAVKVFKSWDVFQEF